MLGLGHIALEAGAIGLTVDPRLDQHHIRASDVYDVRAMLDRKFSRQELNTERFPTLRFWISPSQFRTHGMNSISGIARSERTSSY
ncbi:pyridoxine 5'-phosphate synthase [Roseobacter fucihabitans]|uniref:pyridoxine 5'-phosphate synthase n=1 Tax=Roseobacter fucihabitans TaxID=1537242 RepID=UPI001653059C